MKNDVLKVLGEYDNKNFSVQQIYEDLRRRGHDITISQVYYYAETRHIGVRKMRKHFPDFSDEELLSVVEQTVQHGETPSSRRLAKALGVGYRKVLYKIHRLKMEDRYHYPAPSGGRRALPSDEDVLFYHILGINPGSIARRLTKEGKRITKRGVALRLKSLGEAPHFDRRHYVV